MQQCESILGEEQRFGMGPKRGSEGKFGEGSGGKGKVRGVLTARDRIACRWVCEQGVMTVDQLWRAVL